MSRHDILLRSQFERIIEGDRVGQALISFYEKLPEEITDARCIFYQ